jgi:predicted nuclease of restriction endonuclease-like (RecB) superfamily
MAATYWEIGRKIVLFEQRGLRRAAYGDRMLRRLARDLTLRLGRGFGHANLSQMRRFYLTWRPPALRAPVRPGGTPIVQTLSGISHAARHGPASERFSLPWSHYARLLSVDDPRARRFYELESLRGGWSVRQLDRQISTLYFERSGGECRPLPTDSADPANEVKDPFVLEFLGLKDEYSESELEERLIQSLESFLLELGGDFAFVGRQRRLRVGDEWYRVDLLFYNRRLRCLVVIDLKLGKFTHADAGQMHLYLNYAREHWCLPGENPPVGVILCTHKDASVARYVLDGLPNRILTAEYRTRMPRVSELAARLRLARVAALGPQRKA